MTRHEINGKIKSAPNMCCTCKDGKMFETEDYFKLDEFGGDKEEIICQTCLTKHMLPRYDLSKLSSLSVEGINWFRKIQQVIKTNPTDLKYRELFEALGVCPNHELLPAEPFRTNLGEWKVNVCPVCRVAQTEYKGQILQENVINLLNWIAHESIVAAQNEKLVSDILFQLGDTKPTLDMKTLMG